MQVTSQLEPSPDTAPESTDQPNPPLPTATVAVRDLAAFVHRRGDIHYRYTGSATAVEGIGAQRRAQPSRDGYRREAPVEATFEKNGIRLRIRGRIDGIDEDAGLIEEYKTTRSEVAGLHAHIGHLHLAQLKLYAALVDTMENTAEAASAGRDAWRLRLVYLHPDDGTATHFEHTHERRGLAKFLAETVAAYTAWLARTTARLKRRDACLSGLPFPFPEFRESQRRLARGVYRTFRDRQQLLVEAPTGSGKTAATVFSALRSIGDGALDRVIYLTARTTGKQSPTEAVKQCAVGARASTVVLTAKRDICFNPDLPCDPDCCRYAKGYYDRMRPARDALLDTGLATRDVIERTAAHHGVCPFELSLDAAAWADVIVCDYNYVFDPIVRFERLAAPPFTRVGLLVDEAHQLGDRVRGMLSTSLKRSAVKRALAEAPPSRLASKLRAIDRALLKLRREAREAAAQCGGPEENPGIDASSSRTRLDAEKPEYRIEEPSALVRAVDRLLVESAEVELGAHPETGDFLYDCFRFLEGCGWRDEENYCHLLATDRRNIEARMVCLNPAEHIDAVLRRHNGAVRFSGTVSPLPLFQVVHGQDASSRAARVRLDWGANLGVFVVGDVSTYYRDRDASRDALAGVVEAVVGAAPGNYLVAFPSFAYLDLVVPQLRGMAEVVAQRPGMTDDEKRAFIDRLSSTNGTPPGCDAPASSESLIGAAVMGGMFAESVDFDGGALRGVIVVGVGLVPRSLERDLIGERFGADGFDVAYRQPGMTRVAQAAGRAVRGAGDTGVVVLVDPRFPRADWRAFFPQYWRPVLAGCGEIGAAVASFWRSRN